MPGANRETCHQATTEDIPGWDRCQRRPNNCPRAARSRAASAVAAARFPDCCERYRRALRLAIEPSEGVSCYQQVRLTRQRRVADKVPALNSISRGSDPRHRGEIRIRIPDATPTLCRRTPGTARRVGGRISPLAGRRPLARYPGVERGPPLQVIRRFAQILDKQGRYRSCRRSSQRRFIDKPLMASIAATTCRSDEQRRSAVADRRLRRADRHVGKREQCPFTVTPALSGAAALSRRPISTPGPRGAGYPARPDPASSAPKQAGDEGDGEGAMRLAGCSTKKAKRVRVQKAECRESARVRRRSGGRSDGGAHLGRGPAARRGRARAAAPRPGSSGSPSQLLPLVCSS